MNLCHIELDDLFTRYAEGHPNLKGLRLNELQFDVYRIVSDCPEELIGEKRSGFTPSVTEDGDVPWFVTQDLTAVPDLRITNPITASRTTQELVRAKVDARNTGRSEKLDPIRRGDVLVSFLLTVGVARVYDSDVPAYCNQAIDIIRCKPGFYPDWVALNCAFEYPRYGERQQLGHNLNNEHKRGVRIFVPRAVEGVSSLQLQIALVEFRNWYLEQNSKVEQFASQALRVLTSLEEQTIAALFDDNLREQLEESFDAWAQAQGRASASLRDFEFSRTPLKAFARLVGGSGTKYTKSYYQDTQNQGPYPLMTGALAPVANVEAIASTDVIDAECVSFNKDNDAGSTAFYHDSPFIVGGHHYAVLARHEADVKVLPRYLYFALLAFFRANKFYQSKEPRANSGTIEAVEILLPGGEAERSLAQQAVLVAFLDDRIAYFRQRAALAEEAKETASRLSLVFNQKLFGGAA